MGLCGATTIAELQKQHREWVEEELQLGQSKRDKRWSESIAVGSEPFIDQLNISLGMKAMHKDIIEQDDSYLIKEEHVSYNTLFNGKMDILRLENTIKWDVL